MRHSILILNLSKSRSNLYEVFDKEQYFVTEAVTLSQAKSRLECFCPDIVVVDLRDVSDCLSLCRLLRSKTGNPILVLTTPVDEETTLELFEAGIDAYLTYPINTEELRVRVKALLRQVVPSYGNCDNKIVQLPGLAINPFTMTVSSNRNTQKLTKKELQVLLKLASFPGRVFSREYLMTTVWGFKDVADTRTLDTHIRKLRARFDALEDHCWDIKTIPTIGFKICLRANALAVGS